MFYYIMNGNTKEVIKLRIWHQTLISKLPNKQLGGQWVEIRMILGTIAKHGKVNHSTVNYVNNYPIHYLYAYAYLVFLEREKRGLYSNPLFVSQYFDAFCQWLLYRTSKIVYQEHNNYYLISCIDNLKHKGIDIK